MDQVQASYNPFKQTIVVPGKALLFGEYGVMRGGDAVAVTIPNSRFKFNFEISRCEKNSSGKGLVEFDSRFFAKPLQIHVDQLKKRVIEEEIGEKRNLACYLSPYDYLLSDSFLAVNVIESFSPSLGFGSSSAILSAFHLFLFSFKNQRLLTWPVEQDFWTAIYQSLMQLQGRGSGYDLAVQCWSVLNKSSLEESGSVRCLHFVDQGFRQDAPTILEPVVSALEINPEQLQDFGCFVETGIQSNTRSVLKDVEKRRLDDYFYQQQSFFAREFLRCPTVEKARELCGASSEMAFAAGLLPDSAELSAFTAQCKRQGIAWKTMGAGGGDCLWVLASRKQLEQLIQNHQLKSLSVAFAFEDLKEQQCL